MSERAINAKECAHKLGLPSARSMDKRAFWSPPFPRPILSKPMVWREADVDAWIARASAERNAA